MHNAKRRKGLHQITQRDLFSEIEWRRQNDRENYCRLVKAQREEAENFLALHQCIEVIDHLQEALAQIATFFRGPLIQRDRFGIFAHTYQRKTEIRFIALLVEVQPNQRATDPEGNDRAKHGICQRGPHHVTLSQLESGIA